MIALIQRVSSAEVKVGEALVGSIGAGLLALVCAERGDVPANADALVKKVLRLRVFDDGQGRMNLALTDTRGGLLIVPQFTLAADTGRGTRPSFTPAADPATGRALFLRFVETARTLCGPASAIATGVFGAHMQVALVNDGPVTFWLQIAPSGATATPNATPH
jgi:D-tyrosyl-tRNA(Tyr) deacylase